MQPFASQMRRWRPPRGQTCRTCQGDGQHPYQGPADLETVLQRHWRRRHLVVAKSAQLRFRLRRKLRSLPCSSSPHKIFDFAGAPTAGVLRQGFPGGGELPVFTLPIAHADQRRVFAYLQKRGIAPQVIRGCIEAVLLYEDSLHQAAGHAQESLRPWAALQDDS